MIPFPDLIYHENNRHTHAVPKPHGSMVILYIMEMRISSEMLVYTHGFNAFIAFIASLLHREGKQVIKSKAGAIKCCKEITITASSKA